MEKLFNKGYGSEGVSVVICCYNGESRITETLTHLAQQKVPATLQWEVIIVNNNSTDNTSIAAKRFIEELHSHGADFRVVDQPVSGLSNARQKGIEEAMFDIIIFCDDDNHLDDQYVSHAFNVMMTHPEAGIAGGWVKPKLPFYPGKWIEDFYFSLAIGKQAPADGYVNWVFGAGMILRKKLLAELRDRKIELLLSDRKGVSQSSGGDAELCMVCRFIGYKIYYTSSLTLHHQIAAKRLRKKEFFRSNGDNFHSVVHLFLMEQLMTDPESKLRKVTFYFAQQRVKRLFSAVPRLLIGRNLTLQSIEIYGNFWFLIWILCHRQSMKISFDSIKINLYGQTTAKRSEVARSL